METYSLRLTPGQDLKAALDELASSKKWPAACILSAVGSLSSAALRYAAVHKVEILEGSFEILTLGGTLSQDGSHLHLLVSDSEGNPKGGHLKEGSLVRTTAEIVIGILSGWQFTREPDPETGYLELRAERKE